MDHENGKSRWLRAIPRGIAVALLAAFVLSLVARFSFPELTDTFPPPPSSLPSLLVGLAVWSLSIGLGVLDVLRARRLRCEQATAPYCGSCGYNLEGNESGRCPECGQLVKQMSIGVDVERLNGVDQ